MTTIQRRTSIDQGDYGNVLVHILDYLATKEEQAAKPQPEPEEKGPAPPEPQVTVQQFDDVKGRLERLEEVPGPTQIVDVLKRVEHLEQELKHAKTVLTALIDQERPSIPMREKQRLRQPPKGKPKAKAAKKPPAKKAKRR